MRLSLALMRLGLAMPISPVSCSQMFSLLLAFLTRWPGESAMHISPASIWGGPTHARGRVLSYMPTESHAAIHPPTACLFRALCVVAGLLMAIT